MQDFNSSTELERRILKDIEDKTQYSFPSLSHVEVGNGPLAQKMLEILADWVDLLEESNLRSAIYFVFGKSNHAQSWLEDILRWWKRESDPVAKSLLTVLLSHIVKNEDGPRVWRMCKDLEFRGHFFLFSRLATIPEISEEVVRRILTDLQSGEYSLADLQEYARISDARIRNWFITEGSSSPDRDIRALAARVAGSVKRPDWIIPTATGPDRRYEIYSAEVGLSSLDRTLTRIGKELSVQLQKLGAGKAFLSMTDNSAWFTMTPETGGVQVWLRAEDSDVVEIVVTRIASTQ